MVTQKDTYEVTEVHQVVREEAEVTEVNLHRSGGRQSSRATEQVLGQRGRSKAQRRLQKRTQTGRGHK